MADPKNVATQMVAQNTSTVGANAVAAEVKQSSNVREYIAQHEITGSHQGKRRTWKKGEHLMLDEASAKLLGDAVERV